MVSKAVSRKRKKGYWEKDFQWKQKKQMYKRRRYLGPSIGRGPLLRQQRVKFRYEAQVGINPGAGTTAVHIFSCNGLFDPDITGTGHQPRGFDELMALYDHAVVIGAKITVDWMVDSSETVPSVCGIAIRDFTTTDDYNGYVEGGNAVWGTLSDNNFYPVRQVLQVNPNKFLGRSKPLSDPNLKNSASGNPTEQAYFHLFTRSAFSLDDPGTRVAAAVIEYEAVLIEPKVPAQS